MSLDEASADQILEAEPHTATQYSIRVEGDALVLPSGCTLPLVCVKTNTPVSESDMILTNLRWCPNALSLTGLLGAPALVFAYFVGSELCLITYGLNRRDRYRGIAIMIAKMLAAIGFFAASIFFAVSALPNWVPDSLWIICFALFLVSVATLFLRKQPLYVVDFRDGMFWVKGFSNGYLDSLEL